MEQYEHLNLIYKQLEFIARLYTMDSKKYQEQSEYWLSYADKVLQILIGQPVDIPEEVIRMKKLGKPALYDALIVHPSSI